MKMGPNYLLSHFESRNFAETTVKISVEQKIEKIKYIFFALIQMAEMPLSTLMYTYS